MVTFLQLKKREKHPRGSVTLEECYCILLQGCFPRYEIIQKLPNRAKHHIYYDFYTTKAYLLNVKLFLNNIAQSSPSELCD